MSWLARFCDRFRGGSTAAEFTPSPPRGSRYPGCPLLPGGRIGHGTSGVPSCVEHSWDQWIDWGRDGFDLERKRTPWYLLSRTSVNPPGSHARGIRSRTSTQARKSQKGRLWQAQPPFATTSAPASPVRYWQHGKRQWERPSRFRADVAPEVRQPAARITGRPENADDERAQR